MPVGVNPLPDGDQEPCIVSYGSIRNKLGNAIKFHRRKIYDAFTNKRASRG
jgi:hypothetical protein